MMKINLKAIKIRIVEEKIQYEIKIFLSILTFSPLAGVMKKTNKVRFLKPDKELMANSY